MFTKLIIRVNGKSIEIHAHEVVKIAQEIVNNLTTEPVPIPAYLEHHLNIEKEFKNFMEESIVAYEKYFKLPEHFKVTNSQGHKINNPLLFTLEKLHDKGMSDFLVSGLFIVFEKLSTFVNNKEKPRLLTNPFIKNSIFPAHIMGMNTFSKWHYVSNYLASKFKDEPVSGWWFIISARLILIKNDNPEGHKNHSNPDEPKMCQHFYVSDHGSIVDIVNDLKKCLLNLSWNNEKSFLEIVKFFKHYERLDDLGRIKVKNKFINRLIVDPSIINNPSKLHFVMATLGLPTSHYVEALKTGVIKFPTMIGVRDDNVSDEPDPNLTPEQYRKHEVIFENTLENFRYTSLGILKRYIDPAKSPFYQMIQTVMSQADADKFILQQVLCEIAQDVNLGSHEPLYRPISSYGERDKGDSYHCFEFSIKRYFQNVKHISPQALATQMRDILKGKSVSNDELSFLPNLVGAWFIAEPARNKVSHMTGLMLLDMIENDIEHRDELGNNWYAWENTLIHPQKTKQAKKVIDLYGGRVNIDEFGGSHPMAHAGSVKDSVKALTPKQKLSIVHQKEGSLILDWLYLLLKSNNPNCDVEIISSQEAPLCSHPEYDEILGDLHLKIDNINKKISNLEKDLSLSKDHSTPKNLGRKKLKNELLEQIVLLKEKGKIFDDLIIPLLKQRVSSLNNMFSPILLGKLGNITCRSVISSKRNMDFTENALVHGSSTGDLLYLKYALLMRPAILKTLDWTQSTLLMNAVKGNHESVSEFLLSFNSVNHQNKFGETALHLAATNIWSFCRNSHFYKNKKRYDEMLNCAQRIFSMLLKHNINPVLLNSEGMSALVIMRKALDIMVQEHSNIYVPKILEIINAYVGVPTIEQSADGINNTSIDNLPVFQGVFPGTNTMMLFNEFEVRGDGNCGFYSVGITRSRCVKELLDLAQDGSARNFLAEELVAEIKMGAISPGTFDGDIKKQADDLAINWRKITLEESKLEDEVNKKLALRQPGTPRKSIHSPEFKQQWNIVSSLKRKNQAEYDALTERFNKFNQDCENIQKSIKNFCENEATFRNYVTQLGEKEVGKEGRGGWLGIKGAILLARKMRFTLCIWRKTGLTNQLKWNNSDYHIEPGSTATYHLLYTGGGNHFNLLAEARLENKNNKNPLITTGYNQQTNNLIKQKSNVKSKESPDSAGLGLI